MTSIASRDAATSPTRPWSADRVEQWPIGRLISYANNPRLRSEEEKQAYRLPDNELAARGSWDPDRLRSELRDLKFDGFDLDLIGFEPDRPEEILAGLGSSGLSDPGSVPETPITPSLGPATSGRWVTTASVVVTAPMR